MGEEIPVITEVQEREKEGLKGIVDLVDEPEGEDSPINPRESRRRTRRSLLDEVDDLDQPMRPELLAPRAGGEQEEDLCFSGDLCFFDIRLVMFCFNLCCCSVLCVFMLESVKDMKMDVS